MAIIAVVGMQWGDEGKGKIIDLLTPRGTHGDSLSRWSKRRTHGHSR